MSAYQSSMWMEDSEGVLQRTDHYQLLPCKRTRDDSDSSARLLFILLAACCFLASCVIFWVAGVAALYISYWSGVAGFVLFWCLVTAGIWCVGESSASKDRSKS